MPRATRSVDPIRDLFNSEGYFYFDSALFMSKQQTARQVQFIKQFLDLKPHSRLLDLGCGNGRHLHDLAPTLQSAVGVDSGMKFIQIARKTAKDRGLKNVQFCKQDMRQVKFVSEFDAVIILNTIIGIFAAEDTFRLFQKVNESMVPNGQLCFDVLNRDTVLIDFCVDFTYEKEGNWLIDRCSFDPLSGRITNNRVYMMTGRRRNVKFSLGTFNYSEISAILASAQFTVKRVFSDWDGSDFYERSKKIIIVAQKCN